MEKSGKRRAIERIQETERLQLYDDELETLLRMYNNVYLCKIFEVMYLIIIFILILLNIWRDTVSPVR